MKIRAVTSQEFWIRWAIMADLPECAQIEQACFDFPMDEKALGHYFRERNLITVVAGIGQKSPHNKQKIVCFMVYETQKSRVRIKSIATHPKYQRQGFGRKMIEALVIKLKKLNYQEIIAEVREADLDTQVFLREMGFKGFQNRPEYCEYRKTNYVFVYTIHKNSA